MEKASHIHQCLRALAMLSVVCSVTLHGQVPPGALVVSVGTTFGGAISVDSFDSADPAFSTDGRYDPSKRKSNGDIHSSSPVTIGGTGKVFGRVWAPLVTCTGLGSVGDTNWVLGGHKGIQPGWAHPGTPFQFAEVFAPYSDSLQPSGGTVIIRGVTNSFGGVLGNGDYLLLTNTSVAVTGVARLFAPNGFSGSISLTPGARLDMYVGGAGLGMSSPGTNAQADFVTNLIVYCLPTVTNAALAGTFTGIIYAPEARVAITGGAEVFGSIAAKTVISSGSLLLHYDEQISRWYPPTRPAIASARFVSGVGLQFEVSGSPGLNYMIVTSTNLADWIPSSTNASPFTYTDPDAFAFPSRFYRALWAP